MDREGSDGSGTRIGSPSSLPLAKDESGPSHLHSPPNTITPPSSLREKLNIYLLLISLGISSYILFLTVTTAAKNHTMLSALTPYAVDLTNVTNKTWGYGYIPDKFSEDRPSGHNHGNASTTTTALDPSDTSILYSHMFDNGELYPATVFPTTSDTLDEERPDEVVTYDLNFLVRKHVSTVIQYNRRLTGNLTYRLSHSTCAIQAFMPPFQSLQNNKTFITSGSPIDVYLLAEPPDGPWWAGKDFIKNGNYTLRSNMTWNSKPERVQKLATMNPWPGMNTYSSGTFECPKPSGSKGERVAVEYACTPGATEESCYVSFDAVMKYPILLFELAY